jgi:hypothetical protein
VLHANTTLVDRVELATPPSLSSQPATGLSAPAPAQRAGAQRLCALAHCVISVPRNQWVPFVRKQTSSGSRNPQHRSKLTRRRHGPLPAGYQGAHPRVHFEPWISPLRCSLPVSEVDHDAARLHHAAGWPLSSLAQQPHKVPRIAFLTTASPPGSQYTHAFIRGLADLGRVEGHNIAIEWRWGRGSTEQFPRYAAEVAGLNVDVIVAGNSPAGLAAKNDQDNSHCHCDDGGPGATRIRHEPRSRGRRHRGAQPPDAGLPRTGLPFVSKLSVA